jgi:hypothetical protein
LIVWIIAGLLGMATGLRIGWALVNQQSVVSSAMTVALGGLALVAALNWPPATLLIDTALGWPNISVGLSQAALVASASGSFVMITSVATTRGPAVTRRLAWLQYCVAAAIAAVTMALFLDDERQPEMAPQEYLARNLGASGEVLDWLIPLLYVGLASAVVASVGLRLSNASRRGRALLLFTSGVVLLLAASGFFAGHAIGRTHLVSVGTAAALLLCAMAIVAAGALLPTVEDWIGARRELRLIEPLRRELERRHPDIGIGVRPRGPLVFRVAERLSLISDGLYLESMLAQQHTECDDPIVPERIDQSDRAKIVARWIGVGGAGRFPGRGWLSQPEDCSDRDWILEIARQYRSLKE